MDDFKLEWQDRNEIEVCMSRKGEIILSVDDWTAGVSMHLTAAQAREVAAALIDAANESESMQPTSNADDFGGLPG